MLSIDPAENQRARKPGMWSTEQEVGESIRKEPAQEERTGMRKMMDDAQIF